MQRTVTAVICFLTALGAGAQTPKAEQKDNRGPAAVEPTPVILWDADVVRHWPKTLQRMNLPAMLRSASPGQCLRIGIDANATLDRMLLMPAYASALDSSVPSVCHR